LGALGQRPFETRKRAPEPWQEQPHWACFRSYNLYALE
jgi:hypothetical protein